MTYVGATPTTGDFKKLDSITTSSATTFNLRQNSVAVYPQSANHCIVSLNGVIQAPGDAFNIVNDTVVFSSSLASSDVINFFLVLGNVNDIGTVSDDTVSAAKIQTDAVTQAKIADEAIDEARMQISNAGSNGQFLSKQSGNTGGLTWAAPSGGILVSTGFLSNGTRAAISTGTGEQTLWTTGNFNKTTAGTDLFIILQLAHYASGSGANELWIKYGSGSANYNLGLFNYTGSYGGQTNLFGSLTGHTTTGNQAFTIGFNHDNNANDRPFSVFNPSSTDDARFGQTYSTMLVLEIDNS